MCEYLEFERSAEGPSIETFHFRNDSHFPSNSQHKHTKQLQLLGVRYSWSMSLISSLCTAFCFALTHISM
jgi:hypothetical protein